MKIKGSAEGTECDCILGKKGLLLKFKGFFGGDKGEELIKYRDIINISLEKTAGLVSSPLLIIELADAIKKVALPDKHFKMFYEILEGNIAASHDEFPSEVDNSLNGVTETVNDYSDGVIDEVIESIDVTANKSSGEPVDADESVHFKRIEEAKKLLDMGAITDDEFNLIKNKHLKKM
jgi:hypothetical protein